MARKNDAFYFEAFCASADYSYQAAQLLSKIMHNFDPDRLEEAIDEMHAIEQAADERRHEVLDALVTAFVTPIEREDIAELSEYLDTVTDRIEGVVHRLYFDNITEIRPDALELVGEFHALRPRKIGRRLGRRGIRRRLRAVSVTHGASS